MITFRCLSLLFCLAYMRNLISFFRKVWKTWSEATSFCNRILNIFTRFQFKKCSLLIITRQQLSFSGFCLPHVRKLKTAFGSGLQLLDSSLCQWNLDSGFQSIVGTGFFELYPGFHKQNFSRFRIL